MTAQPAEAQEPFKDYFLILQVHPEADAGMIEAAYWHLAKRYNEESGSDPLAKENLNDLNEAYSALGSPARRQEYLQRRDGVLGAGTLPEAIEPQREPLPLAILEKQAPRSREAAIPRPSRRFALRIDLRLERFVEPSWHNTAVVLIGLIAATSLLAFSASQVYVFALLVACVLASAAPIAWAISRTSDANPERTTQLDRLSGTNRNR